ncbi:MAG: transcriptional repressor [Brevinematales bacterium]|jgi:Fur family ferric uptake transcriptional regulator
MRQPFTSIRKELLDIINNSENPISAAEIFEKYGKKADLSTVYRAIKYLEAEDIIEGFSIFCSTHENMRYYFGAGENHTHFLHCENCHQFRRIDKCFIENIQADIENKYNYKIRHHTLYFTGLCENCRS